MQGKRKYSTVTIRSTKLLTVLLIVGLALTSLAGTALAATDPYLFIDDGTNVNLSSGADGFWVPIKLETTSDISSVAFGLNFDESCLTFDNLTDSNNDGVPDSLSKTHDNVNYSLWYLDVTGEGVKEVIVVARTNTQGSGGDAGVMDLADSGKKVTELRFDVKPSCRTIDGSSVQVNFNFVTKNRWPRLPSISDETGKSLAKNPLADHVVDGAYHLDFNAAPTEVYLDEVAAVDFAENQSGGTAVGALTNNDPDAGDTHTYALVSCTDDDNFAFSIAGAELRSMGPFDYEDDVVLGTDHSFKVCVSATDQHGSSATGTFTVNVTDVNEAPQDIQLLNTIIYEKLPAGSPVDTLVTLGDPDSPETHTYDLPGSPPPECPGPDNGSFQIAVDELQSAEEFDVETKDLYLICVRSTDTGSNEIHRAFTIEIDDENEAPIANNDPDSQVILANTGAPHVFDVLANDTDPEGDDLKVGSVTQPGVGGSVVLTDTPTVGIAFTPAAGYSGPVEFTYKAKEKYGTVPLESNDATVSFYVVNDEDRGDCNNDGEIDAADFSATQLEMWDTSDPITWTQIYMGDYAGSPVGCDSNSSRNGLMGLDPSVDIADVTCTVRLFFGEVCTPIMGSAEETQSSLRVGRDLQVANGSVVVPVALDTAGQNAVSVAFDLVVDPALFAVDADAITFNVPDGAVKVVQADVETGVIKVLVYGVSIPFAPLQDGIIANITLRSIGAAAGQSAVTLENVSIGSDLGRSLPVVVDSWFITFGDDDNDNSLFIPMLQMP